MQEDEPQRFHPLPRISDIRVLDFSPYNILKPLSGSLGPDVEDEEPEVEVTIRHAPSVLMKRRIWQQEVITKLPFQEIVRRDGVVANGVLIDDQRVIVVCVSSSYRKDRMAHH